MTRLVFWLCALWPLLAGADFSTLVIKDMSFSYISPSGQAAAKEIQYENSNGDLLTFSPFDALMNKTDAGVEIIHEGTILAWPLLGNSLSNMDSALAEKLSANKKGGKFRGSFKKFTFKKKEKEYEALSAGFLCEGDTGSGVTRELEKIFNACVAGSTTVAINSITIPENTEEAIVSIWNDGHPFAFIVPNKFTDVSIKMSANAFTLDFKTRSVGVAMTGHMEGTLHYSPPERVVIFQILTFTLGYFDLTEWLFNKVEESASPKIRVERPFIFVTVGAHDFQAIF
jgi:hypothetical protein